MEAKARPYSIRIANHVDDIDFAASGLARISAGGKSFCIIRTEGALKACSVICPHAGGDLSEGFLDKRGNIVCPVHGYRFSLSSGRDSDAEGYFIKIFSVKQTEEGVFVELR